MGSERQRCQPQDDGDDEGALKHYNQAIANDPQNARLYSSGASILMRLNRLHEALADAHYAKLLAEQFMARSNVSRPPLGTPACLWSDRSRLSAATAAATAALSTTTTTGARATPPSAAACAVANADAAAGGVRSTGNSPLPPPPLFAEDTGRGGGHARGGVGSPLTISGFPSAQGLLPEIDMQQNSEVHKYLKVLLYSLRVH